MQQCQAHMPEKEKYTDMQQPSKAHKIAYRYDYAFIPTSMY